MKNKPIEFHPQLLKREDNEPQPESDVHKSPISAFDPIKAAAESFLNLVARPITQLHGLSAEARKDINSLLYQWIAVSTIALVFAAGVSTGPADRLFNTFRAVALVTMPLLQWLTIKYWMRGVPWWLWFFGTILGWACGWYLASPINRILISDILGISYLSSADLSCWYLDCDEFSYSDSRIILTMINVSLSFLTIGGLVGLIQGVLLQRSFLRISRIKWMLASALGMFFGSLIGIPVILFYSSIVNTSPDDFLFALILGLTYGTITGRVLLPHMDTYLKPNQSASSTQTLGHETVSDRLFIVLRSSASRFWMYLGQVFAPVKLSDLRRSLINNLPNWALLCAILAFGSLLVDRDMPLTVLMAVITAFLGYRAMFEISESQGLLKGRRRAIASLLIGLTILAVVLFPSYIRLFFR